MAAIRQMMIVVIGLAASTALGEATLEQPHLGKHATGPRVTAEDLKGRVVLFEYWGVNCGPCVANIPHVTRLQEKYPRSQFLVIANQCQQPGPAEAGKVWRTKSRKDIVTVINHGGLRGAVVNAIPHCLLFDHEGKLVYEGHPSKVDKAVEEAVAKSPGFLAAGHDFQTLRREAMIIGQLRSNLASSLRRVRAAAADESDKGHDDAKFLLQRVTDWATRRHEAIKADPNTDAWQTSEDLKQMIALLRGDELGERFVELDRELKADLKFKEELAAAKMLMKIRVFADKQDVPTDADTPQAKKASASVAQAIDALVKRYPDTAAATEAARIKDELGV
jgi:thiol-disulfide isomerase/thioredoxin